ncbi:MAG TPA: glycosyltransferase family 2 protein [Verrucomicrobiae bacterium]|nr:glycosyltransferase family 2 protein [Verrucomicrobiae bacterium]
MVTVIIPTRPGQGEIRAVTAARGLDYPTDRLEIIIARGRQPAVQRNEALRVAQGELIYFLDDDALASAGNLRRALVHFADPQIKIVGGPNLCPADAPRLEQVFAVVLSSWLAFGPSRARYEEVGVVRASSEKELILCNMMARREAVLAAGGFDESLYPNEENALMDQLQKSGATLLYDPEFIVHRRPRPSLRSFARMLMTYGRGRAEQFRLHPTLGSALNLVPPLFCLYLVLSIPAALWIGPAIFAPLLLYCALLAGQTLVSVVGKGWNGLLAAPLILASHLLYGLGFWRGVFTELKAPGVQPATTVVLERAPVE